MQFSGQAEWKNFLSQFSIEPKLIESHTEILKEMTSLVKAVIVQDIPDQKFGILFSGGVDSTIIAQVCKKEKADFICYTSALKEKGLKHAEDLVVAQKVAKKLGYKLKVKTIGLKETEEYIKKILHILKEPDVVKVGVALPFALAFEQAKKDGIKIMFSGLGSEELFAGYERHTKVSNVNQECFNGLLNMYERDITRDLKVSSAYGIKLKVPYLNPKLIGYALKIPSEYKLSIAQNKLILREVAEQLGLKEFAWRKKRAAQYGSKFDRAIEKLAKRNGFKYKKDYLRSLL